MALIFIPCEFVGVALAVVFVIYLLCIDLWVNCKLFVSTDFEQHNRLGYLIYSKLASVIEVLFDLQEQCCPSIFAHSIFAWQIYCECVCYFFFLQKGLPFACDLLHFPFFISFSIDHTINILCNAATSNYNRMQNGHTNEYEKRRQHTIRL